MGATVFVAPDISPLNFQYGFVDHSAGDAWLWVGANGTFSVAPGATAVITAAGQTLPLFGTTDMKLVLDTTALGGGPWSFATVKVKGSPWYWGLITLHDDGTNGDATPGDGIYTFVLSQYVGAGKIYPHFGLLNSGDIPAFAYEFNGVEYKDLSANAYSTGVTAFVMASGAGIWTPVAVVVNPNPISHNTYITVP